MKIQNSESTHSKMSDKASFPYHRQYHLLEISRLLTFIERAQINSEMDLICCFEGQNIMGTDAHVIGYFECENSSKI